MLRSLIKNLSFLLIIFLLFPRFPQIQAATFTSGISSGDYWRYAIETEHFHLEFLPGIKNQTDSDSDGIADIVENVAEDAEYSWDQEIEKLGFASPLNGQEKILVFLDGADKLLIEGSVGVSSVTSDGKIYLAVDPWQDEEMLQVTVAHEFMHTIQFGYDLSFAESFQDVNFAEASATWMEDYVYDEVNDYYNYLPDYFNYPDYSVFSGIVPPGSLFQYALSVWPKFLTEYFDDQIMVQIWEEFFSLNYQGAENVFAIYTAVKNVLEEKYEAALPEVFQQFMLWNLILENYEEGENYPGITPVQSHSSYPVSEAEPPSDYWPALYGGNYLEFDLGDEEGDFKFTLAKSEEVSFGVVLVPMTSSLSLASDPVLAQFEIGNSGGEVILKDGGNYDKIMAIVTPFEIDFETVESLPGVFENGYQYFYSAQFGDFSTEEEVQTSEEEVELEEASEKEGVEASETSLEGTQEETSDLTVSNLEISSFDDDSVTLSWSRVVNDAVEGYAVYSGAESGVYSERKEISHPWTTYTTINGLTTGVTYYFAVKSYTAEGEDSEYSNEVSITLEEELFPDVPSDHPNYPAISYLVEIGVIEGYPDGTFKPDQTVNRAELLKILIEEIGVTPDEEVYQNCFPDVADDWYAKYVCYAKEQGWVEGYPDLYFRPANTVNKVEALKMLLKVMGYEVEEKGVSSLPYQDTWPAAWYAPYVELAYELGILEEAGNYFSPAAGRTRASICEELFRLLIVQTMGENYSEEVLEEFLGSEA